ncbi:MAG TPA: hypothetical protein VLU92_03550 [Candidatus Dormibacteraeota bacterium]|nr:hypothetical protein [Candidatus Dormibacteraeota bacterium]
MTLEELDIQVQKMGDELRLQAEAITKLVEVVSKLDGVDAGPVKSYALRLKGSHVEAPAAREAPAVVQPATEAAPSSPDQ